MDRDHSIRNQSVSFTQPTATTATTGERPGKAAAVQRRYSSTPARQRPPRDHTDVRAIAQAGVSGNSGPLPYVDQIQRSFGRHDVSHISAHQDGRATKAAGALDAAAYATAHHVAFAFRPDLHTAAHEAAHVIQQGGHVQMYGGLSTPGDPMELHADKVADCVVRGQSAEPLLDEVAHTHTSSHSARAVQRKHDGQKQNHASEAAKVHWHLLYHDIAKRIAYSGKIDATKYPKIAKMWFATPMINGRDGFKAVTLTPRKPGVPTIVAFTGTDDPLDLFADLHAGGVGYDQFLQNKPWIKGALDRAKGPVVLTGHSLGGALAQMAAATFGATLSIAEVVTFQSAGIPAHMKRQFEKIGKGEKPETTHWLAENDAVNIAGQTKLAGDTYMVRNQKKTAAADPVGLHRGDLLTLKSGKVATTGPTRKTKGDPYAGDRQTGERARAKLLVLAKYLQHIFELTVMPATFDALMEHVAKKIDSTWFKLKMMTVSKLVLQGISDRVMPIMKEVSQIRDPRLRRMLQQFVLNNLTLILDKLKQSLED